MKLYIVTDLEGPAGVNLWLQTREGATPENRAAKSLLTAEVNAAVEGILDAAPGSEIVVRDGHGSGGLIYEDLHPEVQSIMYGINSEGNDLLADRGDYDALLFVGQHAMANTPNAPLCHTFSSLSIDHYKLNGQLIGETGCIAARFGEMNVPTIFLAGDDKACQEAQMHIPEIVTAATKQGLGVQMALHLSPQVAQKRIREGAKAAIKNRNDIPAFKISAPYELEIRVLEGVGIQHYLNSGKYEFVDSRTVLRRADRINDLFT